jgi:CheY-like chemotaxis protein
LKSANDKEKSSTDVLLKQLLDAFKKEGARGEIVRAVDCDIKPGVKSDEGEGDAWPALRQRVVDADILVIGTPIWLGQPSSVAKRVLERMDAFLGETDARGRMPSYGKVAVAVVVGNEDGAHHTAAELFQALIEVGFTIPAGGVTYWVGEAMGDKDYKDFAKAPKAVAEWTPCLRGETILVIEDDEGVRSYVGEILQELGYRVLIAKDGKAALLMIEQPEHHIDLLLTDVVLPGMNGRQVADEVRASRSDIKVLFMTGYSRNAIVHQGRLDRGVALIQKPLSRKALALKVREVLVSD